MVRLATGELLFQRGDLDAPPDASVEEAPTVASVVDGSAAENVAAGVVEEDAAEVSDALAAAKIQSMQRGKIARRELGEQRAAATRIQAMRRGKVARRSCSTLDRSPRAPIPDPEPEPEPDIASKSVPKRTGKGGGVVSRLTAKTYDQSIVEKVKARKKPQSKKIDGDFLSRLNRPTAGARAEAEGKTLSKGKSSFGAEAAQRRKTPPNGKQSKQVVVRGSVKANTRPVGAATSAAGTPLGVPNDTEDGDETAPPVVTRAIVDSTRGGGLLQPLLREINSSMGPAATTSATEDPALVGLDRIKKFADCGIFTREQLMHTLQTRASQGLTLPYEAYFRGRCFLFNELIATCSNGETEVVEVADALAAGITAREGVELGAATHDADGQPGVNLEAPLAAALILVDRTDIRPPLMRIGITTVAAFLQATDSIDVGSSIISVELNQKMRAAGERILAEDTLKRIRACCVKQADPPGLSESKTDGANKPRRGRAVRGKTGQGTQGKKKISNEMDGCKLKGTHGRQWSILKKETSRLPGAPETTAAADAAQEKRGKRGQARAVTSRDNGDPPDVYYVEGDLPIVIGVPFAGNAGWSGCGSASSVNEWSGFGNGNAERRVALYPEPRGEGGTTVGDIGVGVEMTDPEGRVRAETTRPLGQQDKFLYYHLLPTNTVDDDTGRPVDWEVNSWIYLASDQRLAVGGGTPSSFFKVAAQSEPTGQLDSHWSEAESGRRDVLELVDRLRERSFDTVGGTPHVVVVSLHPAIVDVTLSREHCIATFSGTDSLRARAEDAWCNYHTFVEVAKWRQMEGSKKRRGGTGLFAEVSHRLLQGSSGSSSKMVELGYGLARFELAAALKPPDGKMKPPDDRVIAKAFSMFDTDGSGSIDLNELRGVCKQIGVPMTDDDLRAAMAEIDEDGSGELDKKEFKAWFKSLSAAGTGGKGGSRLEEIKVRSILSGSTVAGLSRRMQGGSSPRDALVGETALGTLFGAYGLECAPSATKPSGNSVGGAVGGGQYSVSAHGSKQGGSTVDSVQIGLPPGLWKDANPDGGPSSDLIRLAASSVADGLVAYVSANCGLQKVPGSGALRRSRGLKRDMWKRFVTETSVTGVQTDGTLHVR
jgi:hypothetical protein